MSLPGCTHLDDREFIVTLRQHQMSLLCRFGLPRGVRNSASSRDDFSRYGIMLTHAFFLFG